MKLAKIKSTGELCVIKHEGRKYKTYLQPVQIPIIINGREVIKTMAEVVETTSFTTVVLEDGSLKAIAGDELEIIEELEDD